MIDGRILKILNIARLKLTVVIVKDAYALTK